MSILLDLAFNPLFKTKLLSALEHLEKKLEMIAHACHVMSARGVRVHAVIKHTTHNKLSKEQATDTVKWLEDSGVDCSENFSAFQMFKLDRKLCGSRRGSF